MPTAQANGIELFYERRGVGDPLLLTMGLGGQLTDWRDGFVDALIAEGFEVILYDNRDVGLSSHFDDDPEPTTLQMGLGLLFGRTPPHSYTLMDMADDAAGLLAHLGIESAHAFGVSMGGMISQELAIRHPEKVTSLTSVMSHPGDGRSGRSDPRVLLNMARRPVPTPETAVEQVLRTASWFSGPHFDPELSRPVVQRSVDRALRPQGTSRQTAAIAASRDRSALLGDVVAPTLVIHGLRDPLVNFSGGVATAKAVAGSRLLAFDDMGHDVPMPRWAEIAAAVRTNADRAGVPQTV